MSQRNSGFRPWMAWGLPIAFALAGTSVGTAARADEASDLRANNQLLQQRLDQLAQQPSVPGNVYGVGPANPAATTGATGGSFPRSFLIPGTDTSIRIGGQITEIVDYWLSGGPPNGSPQSTTVGDNGQVQALPLGSGGQGSRGNGIFQQSPRESKLSVETRTPSPYGEVRTFMEFDWAGSTNYAPGGANPTSVSDNLHPRLRYAYGTLGGLLAGQANSNFSDPDADSETIDFGGNVGGPGVVRIPQVRYTIPTGWWGSAIAFSAETPETDILTPLGLVGSDAGVSSAAVSPGQNACTVTGVAGATCTVGAALNVNPAKSTAPDLTAAWFIPQPWGHLDFAAVVRPGLDIQDGKFLSRQFIGYGVQVSGVFKPGWMGWAKDSIQGHFTVGDALGRYLNSSTNFALATNFRAATTSPANAATILVKPTRQLGVNVGYTHHWSPNLRSTINFGYNRQDLDAPISLIGSQAGAGNKEIYTSHLNLIWSPVSFVDIGAEYMYGHRVVFNNQSGNENTLIGEFKFRF